MAANLSNATSFVGVYSPFCTEVSPVWIFFRSTRFVCMDCLIFRFIDLMKLHGAFWEAKWGKQSEVWFRWSPHPCARRCPDIITCITIPHPQWFFQWSRQWPPLICPAVQNPLAAPAMMRNHSFPGHKFFVPKLHEHFFPSATLP